jgi:hypothetical protein
MHSGLGGVQRQLPCPLLDGGGTLSPRQILPYTVLQGSEGFRLGWDGRPTEAESPLLSQGSSPFFFPPPPSVSASPHQGLAERGGRLARARVGAAARSRSGPGTAQHGWPGPGGGGLGAWEREGAEEAEAGAGPPRARRQARGRPWAGRGGRGGGGPRVGRQARGCGHGAQPPAHADRRRRRRCCSRHPSAGGGVAEQAAPQSPPRPARRLAPRPPGPEELRGATPRPAAPRWGPPGPGRHGGAGDQVALGGPGALPVGPAFNPGGGRGGEPGN